MKPVKILLAGLAFASVSLVAAGTASACALCGMPIYEISNVDHFVSLRKTPSTRAPRLSKIRKGTHVESMGGEHQTMYYDWINIHYNGQTGWIPTDYLKKIGVVGKPIRQAKGPKSANASSCGGVVRSGPSMNARRVGSLQEGKRIRVMGETGEWMNGYQWFKIRYNGKIGYQWGGILSADNLRNGSYVGC